MSQRSWKRIPTEYREELRASVDKMNSGFYAQTLALENKAIQVMRENGLIVNTPTGADRGRWVELLGEDYDSFVGQDKIISPDAFDAYKEKMEAFRNR